MKMINSKAYNFDEALKEGSCAMCGKTLTWVAAPFEPKIAATSICCSFLHVLTPNFESSDEVFAKVLPITDEV